jgi:hypothetical protein
MTQKIFASEINKETKYRSKNGDRTFSTGEKLDRPLILGKDIL